MPVAEVSLNGPTPSETSADAEGKFVFSALQPGSYVLKSEASGMTATQVLVVTAGAVSAVSLEMKVAVVEQSTSVTASSDAMGTQEPAGTNTVGEQAVKDMLPIGTANHTWYEGKQVFAALVPTSGRFPIVSPRRPRWCAIRTLAVYIAMTFLRLIVTLSRSRKFGRNPEARRVNCAFGTLQGSMALLVLLSLMHPSRAFAVSPDLETVLTGSRQRIEKLDYRATGRLTRVEGNGKRTSYKFAAKAHWFPDGLRLLSEISGPGSEKTSILLHMSVSGHVTIEAVLPGQEAASVLPFERWNDPLVGTDFSYEDMVENQFFWKSQALLAPEKYGARDCFVLKSVSGSQDRTYYDSVTSWIDRGILYPVHVVKTLRGTGQQKEFIYYGLRKIGGVWSATQVEAKLQGKPGSSILVIEGGSGKANLGRKDFDISQSGAPPRK